MCHSSKRYLEDAWGVQVRIVYMEVAGKDLIKENQKERTQKKIGMKVQIWSSAVCVRVMGVICVSCGE